MGKTQTSADWREIEVTERHWGKVNVSLFFTEFAEEWRDFLDGEEPTDELREKFIRESCFEMGRDVLDLADSFDSEFDIEIPKRRRRDG